MRQLDLHVREGKPFELAISAVRNAKPVDYHVILPEQKDRRVISILLRDSTSQSLVDALQQALEGEKDWRMSILPVEATMPKVETSKKDNYGRALNDCGGGRPEL